MAKEAKRKNLSSIKELESRLREEIERKEYAEKALADISQRLWASNVTWDRAAVLIDIPTAVSITPEQQDAALMCYPRANGEKEEEWRYRAFTVYATELVNAVVNGELSSTTCHLLIGQRKR